MVESGVAMGNCWSHRSQGRTTDVRGALTSTANGNDVVDEVAEATGVSPWIQVAFCSSDFCLSSFS